ncbi:MAG: 50S ribosomal protein L18e [Candidatus Helarchaeota archaeon]
MKLKTKSSNENYIKLIKMLWKTKRRSWRAVYNWLNKPNKKRVVVNINKINRFAKENDQIIIPGKILGDGNFDHKIASIAALSFSESARKKILENKIKLETIEELYNRNPEGKKIKIIV